MTKEIKIYDTTLRDGAQAEGIAFTVEDKLKIATKLDELGVHYIEGGWPGSNPKDIEFFERVKGHKWMHAKLAAFGSTCRAGTAASKDPLLQQLVESGAPVITIFGKSWDYHVTKVLRTTLEENLRMIRDSVAFLKSTGREVIFDAEHFFDGYRANPDYTMATLQAALEGGADAVVLCDTNGGSLPWQVEDAVRAVVQKLTCPVGIHAHNDSELAVANSIAAVKAGATHVQGTMNGWGERVGNANLCSIIPSLQIKMGYQCLPPDKLAQLTDASLYVYEIANIPPLERQPYVGRSAFAHKAGMHVDAVMKSPSTFEHIDPALVGNSRRFLISEQSGGSAIRVKAREFGIDLDKGSPEARAILEQVVRLENEGYVFEGAEASFELLVRKVLGTYKKLFDLKGFRVIVEKRGHDAEVVTEATLKVAVDGEECLTVAEGDGPVHALDGAMRKALLHFYPELADIRLTDFKVRVVNVKEGTAAKVRVLVESSAHEDSWSTIGVSTNIIEASWQALVDAVEYGLTRHQRMRQASAQKSRQENQQADEQ